MCAECVVSVGSVCYQCVTCVWSVYTQCVLSVVSVCEQCGVNVWPVCGKCVLAENLFFCFLNLCCSDIIFFYLSCFLDLFLLCPR